MFTSAIPYKLKRTLRDRTTAYFTDCEHDYRVYIDPDTVDERFWDVSFCASIGEYLIDEDLTGAGNANRVLSTVIAVMREHESHYGIRPLRLQAADDKRCRLYSKMAKKLLPEWSIHVAGRNVIVLPQSYCTRG